MEQTIKVLNHGSIDFINSTPNPELAIVNAARVSFGKWKNELDTSDERLIEYLIKNKHDSPIRHVHMTFRIKAPEFVMRQWYKHIVGIEYSPAPEKDHAWNEISGRYIEYEDEFYYPDSFRQQSKSNKQATTDVEVSDVEAAQAEYALANKNAYISYKKLLELGVGREIARCILPQSLYTSIIWTCSLQAILNFISLRDHEHAQYEIRVYAQALRELLKDIIPHVMAAWDKYRS